MITKTVVIFLTILGSTIGREEGVLNLTNDDFSSRMADIDVTFVMFYDDWCTYCNMIPQLEKANELLSEANSQIAIAKVNCRSDGKNICLEYGIEIGEYLKFKIFRMGKLGQDYGGPEEADAIVFFRAPQYHNKFETNSIAYKGNSTEELTALIKKNLIENFKQFLTDFKEGKLEIFVKPEPIPKTNDGPVKIANNFKEVVMNNGKDTFLELYAPWCSYCQKLAPIYEELGTLMRDEDIEIVKFDATKNELPFAFELQGYPTLLWFPKDAKRKPIRYTDCNKLENFVKYIAQQATNELKNYDRNGEVKKTEL